MKTVGQKIRELREAAGYSVDDVAAAIGKNRATVYRYESDSIEMPVSVVGPLSSFLGCDPRYLMGWVTSDELVDKFNKLTPGERKMLSAQIDGLLQAREEIN